MDDLLIQKIAVSLIPKLPSEALGAFLADNTLDDFFALDSAQLVARLGLRSSVAIPRSVRDDALLRARKEAEFIRTYGVKTLFIGDDDYPTRLRESGYGPAMLYVLGNHEVLSRGKQLAIVGTRMPTAAGVEACRRTVECLANDCHDDIDIVSGLAYGIDKTAHEAAIDSGVPTVAVMAGGLDNIYPAMHRDLARRIIASGGALVTEYCSGEKPLKPRFLKRNSIIAGLSDGTLVVESGYRGGALATANFAFRMNRQVMAFPGRVTDEQSAGCNKLIHRLVAALVRDGADIEELLGWTSTESNERQPSLFADQVAEEAAPIIAWMRSTGRQSFELDEISAAMGIPIGPLTGILLDLEADGHISRISSSKYTF